MISTRSSALALAILLASCGAQDKASPPDWRGLLAAGNGIAAEQALKDALGRGEPRENLAPFLGEAELLQGELGEAREWLGEAAFAPGVAVRGFHMLGRLHFREGNLPAAGQAFDRALASGSDGYDLAPELWVDIARLRYRGGEHIQAIDAADKAVALGPVNPTALLLQAQLVRDAQGNAAALPLFERGLAAAPDHPDLLADYAATLGELGRAKDMLVAVRRFAIAGPGDPRVLYLQAVLAARAGEFSLARGLLQRSGNLERQMPAAILLLAVVDLESGNPASAAQGLDRLLRRQPDNLRVQLVLARALAMGGRHRELIARFGTRADDRYLALLVGRAYEAVGDRTGAATYLDRAAVTNLPARIAALPAEIPLDAAVNRDDTLGAVAAVRGLIAQGRTNEARARAARPAARFKGSADASALAGDGALAAGDSRTALAHYRRSALVRRPWTLTKRMAAALERQGKLAEAEALVAAHLAGEPNNAEAARMLARRAAAAGNGARANLLAEHARAQGG